MSTPVLPFRKKNEISPNQLNNNTAAGEKIQKSASTRLFSPLPPKWKLSSKILKSVLPQYQCQTR